MKLPNKVLNYKESIISKFPIILSLLECKKYSILTLYSKVKNQVDGINEFLEILDSLYALNKIQLDESSRRLYYVN